MQLARISGKLVKIIPELAQLTVKTAAGIGSRISLYPWAWAAGGIVGLVVLIMPRRTSALSYIDSSIRDNWYGPIRYIKAPTPDNAEGIIITNDFSKNIVRHTFPILGAIYLHREAVPSLSKIMQEIERKGWASKVKKFDGSYVPRFVRGSHSTLSSHAYGTSIDINARDNPQGSEPTEDQKLLAPIFEKNGWYWGDRFSKRDPMHFEFIMKPKTIS